MRARQFINQILCIEQKVKNVANLFDVVKSSNHIQTEGAGLYQGMQLFIEL